MKYVLATMLLVSLGCLSMQPQQNISSTSASLLSKPYKPFAEFKGDTLRYLQYNFIERKDQYEGKKLSVLLQDLEFDIKYFSYGIIGNDQNRSLSISTSFYDSNTHNTKRENGEKLYILGFKWAAPIMTADIDKLDKQYGYYWSKHHQKFFSDYILKNVFVTALPDPKRPK